MQQVWQTEGIDKDIDVVSCNEQFSKSGFIAPLYKIEGKSYRCYADLISQAVINFNGNVYKCTARDFANHKPDGVLQNDGTIKWNNVFYKRMSSTTIENINCISCHLLPACWGPCSQKMIETNKNDFNKICNKLGIEKTIQILMIDFYKTNILNKKK